MLQKEFETRTGLQVTPAEYVTIERMYYACDNTDKDEFCKLWLENHKKPNGLVTGLFDEVKKLDSAIKSSEATISNLQSQLEREKEAHQKFASDMADFLLTEAYENDDDTLRAKVIMLLGNKEYLIRKVKRGYEFSTKDYELVQELLTDNK